MRPVAPSSKKQERRRQRLCLTDRSKQGEPECSSCHPIRRCADVRRPVSTRDAKMLFADSAGRRRKIFSGEPWNTDNARQRALAVMVPPSVGDVRGAWRGILWWRRRVASAAGVIRLECISLVSIRAESSTRALSCASIPDVVSEPERQLSRGEAPCRRVQKAKSRQVRRFF
jgi:hypothetical protein